MDLPSFLQQMPKAELHLHLEGTLEPDLLFALARRNQVALPFATPQAVAAAYQFADLQQFLDLYYLGCRVLTAPEDFHDLALAYFARCQAETILHTEIFIDPQAHTARGVPIAHVFDGVFAAIAEAERRWGLSVGVIMCFLRHLDAAEGFRLLEAAAPYLGRLAGVGLDSSERGHPPAKYAGVFAEAKRLGLNRVAHAGEEGPAQYVWDALRLLDVARIDHGVRAIDDPALVAHLAAERIPLTICPLSNIKLRVFADMAQHSLAALLRAGVMVTINSDDPAYFGGYLTANYLACAAPLGLDARDFCRIARNSFAASFLPEPRKVALLQRLDQFAQAHGSALLP